MKRTTLLAAAFLVLSQVAAHAHAPTGGELDQGINDLKSESYEEAVHNLSHHVEAEPGSALGHYYLGVAYLKTHDLASAKTRLSKAVRLDPSHGQARLSLAEALYRLNDTDGALRETAAAEAAGTGTGALHLLKGLALSKAGRADEALAAFAAAKAADPALAQAADYQTGLVLVKEKRLKEAREAFGAAAIKDPNTDLALFAGEFESSLEKKMDRERPLKLSLGLRFEYDDNVLLKPADSAAASGVSGQIDRREVLTARAEHYKALEGPWSLKSGYFLYLSNHHHLETHDIQSHTLNLTPTRSTESGSLNLDLSYSLALVDGSSYLQSVAFSPGYNHLIAPSKVASVAARFKKREYAKEPFSAAEDRDSTEAALSIGYSSVFPRDGGYASLRYEVSQEDTDGANWEYTGHKASLNVLYQLRKGLKAQGYIEAFLQDFSNTNTYFGKKRTDRTYTLSAVLSYTVFESTDLIAQYTRVRDDSNIAQYDYERDIISVGLEWRL